MHKIVLIVVTILLYNMDVSMGHRTNKTNVIIESNKKFTKNIYHFEVHGNKFATEDDHILEKNSLFALFSAR